jgi:hypothetical protein
VVKRVTVWCIVVVYALMVCGGVLEAGCCQNEFAEAYWRLVAARMTLLNPRLNMTRTGTFIPRSNSRYTRSHIAADRKTEAFWLRDTAVA